MKKVLIILAISSLVFVSGCYPDPAEDEKKYTQTIEGQIISFDADASGDNPSLTFILMTDYDEKFNCKSKNFLDKNNIDNLSKKWTFPQARKAEELIRSAMTEDQDVQVHGRWNDKTSVFDFIGITVEEKTTGINK